MQGAEIGALLSMEEQKQLLGCSDGECLAEIAGDAGDKVASEIFKQDTFIITGVGLALLWLIAGSPGWTRWSCWRT